MAVSPNNTMLAVGGSDPSDCHIFNIQHHNGAHPTFTPKQVLMVGPAVDAHLWLIQHEAGTVHKRLLCQGHGDWLFGMTWLTDKCIVTGTG